jgi:cation:H+ antiporter
MPLLKVWAEFAFCLSLIGYAGTRLSVYGDVIADKTGLSGNWIGLVMLATATSLPELMTGISAVSLADAPDIALGDVLGSCVFNLVILVVVDFLYRRESIYRRASQGHVLSAGFGVVLLGVVGFNLLLGKRVDWRLGHVGAYTPAIVLLYLIAVRSIFLYEKQQVTEFAEEVADRYPHMTLKRALLGYGLAALAVAAAGVWMPFVAEDLAVTVGAVWLGALDMAIANLLGSNLFDILIIAIDDVFYRPGPLLAHVADIHAVSALSALIMTGLAIVGLLYRPQGRVLRSVGWISLGLLSVYLLNALVVFLAHD